MPSIPATNFTKTHVLASKAVKFYAILVAAAVLEVVVLLAITTASRYYSGLSDAASVEIVGYSVIGGIIAYLVVLFAAMAYVDAPLSQMELSRNLVGIEEMLDAAALPDGFAESEPLVASSLMAVLDRFSAWLGVLFETIEGLDGANRSNIGEAVIANLADDARRLSAEVKAISGVVGDCPQLGLLLNDRSREAARSVILVKVQRL